MTGTEHAPDRAYALAPSITSELGWTAYHAVGRPTGALLGREFWLRRAAVLDRIALGDEVESVFRDACEAATDAARRLIEFDRSGEGDYHGAPYWPDHPGTTADPRRYVRQEYAHWAKNH